MKHSDQTEYIVHAIREGASMYEEDARAFLAEHDAHVRAERDAMTVAWLVKKAREFRAAGGQERAAQADAVAAMASKIERGAVRANNLRMLAADFYEPGHTYTEPDGSTDWRFRCDTVTTHPEHGGRTALGWRHFQGEWTECAYGEDDWKVHLFGGVTDVTEGRES